MANIPFTINTILHECWVAITVKEIEREADRFQGVRSFAVQVQSLEGASKRLQHGVVKIHDHLWEDTDSPFVKSPKEPNIESIAILRFFLDWAQKNPQQISSDSALFLDYPQLENLLPKKVADDQAELRIRSLFEAATRINRRADFTKKDLVVVTGIESLSVQKTLDWLIEVGQIKPLENNAERWRWVAAISEAKNIVGAGVTISDMNTSQSPERNKKTVFIIHGRNMKALDALIQFLTSLGLDPHDFDDIRRKMSGTPTIWEVVEAALTQAQAIIVLATPDEHVALHPDFRGSHEVDRWQPRPNVLIEAGAAMIMGRERTLLVRFGDADIATDFSGLRFEKIGNDGYSRKLFRDLLETAGCIVNNNNHYQLPDRSGDFVTTLPKLPNTHSPFETDSSS